LDVQILPAASFGLLILLLMAVRDHASRRRRTRNRTGEDKNAFKLISSTFKEGQPIPRAYTCDGANVSPSLEWK